jgi:toxin ParE1/3/4
VTRTIIFRRQAESEYDAAVTWYEGQQAGLGAALAAEVRKVLGVIARKPVRYPVAARDIREGPVARFPYCVYYRVRPGQIVVIAVFHTSRNPAEWQSRG